MSAGDRLDLDAIRRKVEKYKLQDWTGARAATGLALAEYVPALLAEVGRLRAELDQRDDALSGLRQDVEFQTSAAFANQAEANRLRERIDAALAVQFRPLAAAAFPMARVHRALRGEPS